MLIEQFHIKPNRQANTIISYQASIVARFLIKFKPFFDYNTLKSVGVCMFISLKCISKVLTRKGISVLTLDFQLIYVAVYFIHEIVSCFVLRMYDIF